MRKAKLRVQNIRVSEYLSIPFCVCFVFQRASRTPSSTFSSSSSCVTTGYSFISELIESECYFALWKLEHWNVVVESHTRVGARMHYSYRNSAILVSNFFQDFLEISDFFQNPGLAFFWDQGNIGTFDDFKRPLSPQISETYCDDDNLLGIRRIEAWPMYFFCIRAAPKRTETEQNRQNLTQKRDCKKLQSRFCLSFGQKLSKIDRIWLKRGTAKNCSPYFAFISDRNWAIPGSAFVSDSSNRGCNIFEVLLTPFALFRFQETYFSMRLRRS